MIFIYVVVWQAWFYGWGFYALGQDDTLERRLTGQPAKPSPDTTAHDVEISSRYRSPPALPQQQGESGGVDVNHVREREAGFGDSVVVVDVERRKAESQDYSTASIASASRKERPDDDQPEGLRRRVSRILLSPNIVAVVIGLIVAMIAPLQKLLFDNPRAILRPLGAAVEVCSLV